MGCDLQSIIDGFAKITEEAIASGEALDRIVSLCNDVEGLEEPPRAFPAFFGLMERFPNGELGSPGPLVHTMEQHVGFYEDLLEASVQRLPTSLSVWMVNRILNARSSDRQRWLPLLRSVVVHPAASEGTISEARMFLEHQGAR